MLIGLRFDATLPVRHRQQLAAVPPPLLNEQATCAELAAWIASVAGVGVGGLPVLSLGGLVAPPSLPAAPFLARADARDLLIDVHPPDDNLSLPAAAAASAAAVAAVATAATAAGAGAEASPQVSATAAASSKRARRSSADAADAGGASKAAAKEERRRARRREKEEKEAREAREAREEARGEEDAGRGLEV
ncbi:hypothetical protein EMIHUDRAFT_109146 [Emiliania huxleyi CCMP1516]|uniref:Uncharacterized protein n=2 Tax=Emiliania huxleyi TaxID=2903 RepID=A0A0D3KT36_EMIH1|nr:hypothetical protein EMIHUDRAFT_109146 [Emiliania huxleyi CCMP1516]EOD38921.1 hypothetical protein EMIHUDRAFT_109146 [Emiliania huxleyi CCMP1516]|eukprot:XP_005791350.1 hypothetical protein EMIHUDRAFT_109146 [Emiliania huxleyi CCMP1516]